MADALLDLGHQNIIYDEFSAAIPILEEAFEVGLDTGDSASWVTALGSQSYAHGIRFKALRILMYPIIYATLSYYSPSNN